MTDRNWTWNILGAQWECLHRQWICSVSLCANGWQYHAVLRTTGEVQHITGTAPTAADAKAAAIAAVDRMVRQ